MASSTKNIKGNRKVVRVFLPPQVPEIIFKIPDGLDLEDKTVVENWWYKWGTLHIKYVGKEKVEEFEAEEEPELDVKYAEEIEIIDADDALSCCVDYSEDEDEEEDKDEEDEEEKCVCPKCQGEGWCFVSKARANELKAQELMEECCPFGNSCVGDEYED